MVYRAEIWYNSLPSWSNPYGCTLKVLGVDEFQLDRDMARILSNQCVDPPGVTQGWTPKNLTMGLMVTIS